MSGRSITSNIGHMDLMDEHVARDAGKAPFRDRRRDDLLSEGREYVRRSAFGYAPHFVQQDDLIKTLLLRALGPAKICGP